LGDGLHYQHAGHDGQAGKMAVEKWLVDGDVLDGDDALFAFEFENTVDEQQRITVRKYLENVVDAEPGGRIGLFEGSCSAIGHLSWFVPSSVKIIL
jgi:hypothetical protein